MLSAAFLLAASMVVGQAEDPIANHEHLKSFDALIGCWLLDGELLEDSPDGTEKGAKMIAHVTYEWILNKQAIQTHGKLKIGDAEETEFVWLIGWNLAEECIFRKGVGSNGASDDAVIEVGADGKSWTWKIEQVTPDGGEVSRTVVLALSDEDTLVWQELNRPEPQTGDSPKYTLKRCSKQH